MMDDLCCTNTVQSASNADCLFKMDTSSTTARTTQAKCVGASDVIREGAAARASSSHGCHESSARQQNFPTTKDPSHAGVRVTYRQCRTPSVSPTLTTTRSHFEVGSATRSTGNQDRPRSNSATTLQDTFTLSTMENDSYDATEAPQRLPLHASVSWAELEEVPSASFPNTIMETPSDAPAVSLTSVSRPRLTLSAFRRPENAVRIADMDPSRKITTDYDFDAPECRVLGHGASSTVRLALRRKDGIPVAVKSVAKHEALRFRRMRNGSRRHLDEWELLRSLRGNPHVVSLLDVFETDEEVQLVLEYCQGGELFDVIQAKRNEAHVSPDKVYRYSESKASKIVSQMLSVLAELHSRGIVHRDVKPENILLSSDGLTAKLSDFGTSRELHPEAEESDSCSSDGEESPLTPQSRKRAYSAVGSNFYAAPEVHAGHGYGTPVDVYSLGVTLYVLLCGFPPSFATSNDDDDVVTFPRSHWSCISQDAKQLIRRMLEQDANRRITAAEALKHPWITHQARRSLSALWSQGRTVLSPGTPRPVVDMELVRIRLYKGLGNSDNDDDEQMDTSSIDEEHRLQKRRKLEEDEPPALLTAMADYLCEGLECVAASATAAAAGVIMDDNDDIRVMEDVEGRVEKDCPRVGSPFESSFTALSV